MKYYIDTSSLVKIYHREPGSPVVFGIYKSDDNIVISELSTIEFQSGVARKHREHEITLDTLHAVIQKFEEDMDARYDIVSFSSLVIDEARSLLRPNAETHGLKTLDSLQLAFFKTYCEDDTTFVCSDVTLGKIAEQEGFQVLTP